MINQDQEAREIVRALAREDVMIEVDGGRLLKCEMCLYWSTFGEQKRHRDDCPYCRAVEWVERWGDE